MLAHVFQICFDHFRAVVGVVDFDTVERNFGTYLVEQGNVVEGEITLVASRMGDEAKSTTAMPGIDGCCHIGHD